VSTGAEAKFVTVRDASQLLGVGLHKVYELIRTGALPAVSFGAKRTMVPIDAIDAIVAASMKGFDPARAVDAMRPSSSRVIG
jgi:excisionase family DNA binding protein